MRRIFLTAIASSALVMAAPSIASASHHGRSKPCHRAHHAKHSSCASRARRLRFGAPLVAGAPAGSAPSSSTPPATAGTPGSPTTPTPGETAGTVKSFTEGVLVITLNDGTTVSGKVTEQTEIHCQAASSAGSDDGSDEGQQTDGEDGSSSSGAPNPSAGADARAASAGSDGEGGGSGHNGDNEGSGDNERAGDDEGSGDDEGTRGPCTTAALVPGAVVREAELSIGGAGAVWDHIELMP
jgi:hypothetical protein